MTVKYEVEYEVIEVTRYRIVRKIQTNGPAGWSVGQSAAINREYGEFDDERAAQRVADALERAEGARIGTL